MASHHVRPRRRYGARVPDRPRLTRRRGSVAGTVVAGVAVVSGLRWFRWRRRHRGPAEVRELRRLELEPNPTGAGLVLAVNTGAGSAGDIAEQLERLLPEAEVVALEDPTTLPDVIAEAAGRTGVVAVGVAGGDGSINTTAAIAAERGLPVAAVPGGTLNHLSRDLGLGSVEDTVAAVTAGTAVEVDLPSIDGRPFLNTASFGSYAELVDAREGLEDRIGKWPALAVAAWRVLRKGSPIEVELDGVPRSLWMIFIGNCRYEPDGFAPSRRTRLDDGQLDIRIIDASHPFCRTRLVAGLLTGRLGRSPVYRQWAATALIVRSLDGPLRLACDGETFDGSEDVEVVKTGRRVALYSAIPD